MRARVVATARGVRWLAEGWRFFRASPLGWLALVSAYLMLIWLAALIPVAGMLAIALLTPAISVGFMAVARAASLGAPLDVKLLLDGLRQAPRAQLALGAVYLACIAVLLGLTTLLAGERPEPGKQSAEEAFGALALVIALYAPVMIMFWFAPTLAAWHSSSVMKALFFSVMAFLMNWRAFLAYGTVTAAAMLALTSAAVLIARVAAPEMQVTSLAVPLFVTVFPTLLGSYYASYRDIFADPE